MTSLATSLLRAAWLNGVAGVPSPLILLLEPSQRCNARCSFCYHWREEGGEELTAEEIVRVMGEAWELGCRVLYLSGGEPTLLSDVQGILGAAKSMGYRISMTTNGSVLQSRLPTLAPYLDGVTVSLDYAGPRHDEVRGIPGLYGKAVGGLLAASRAGVPARINMSLHPGNLGEVEGLARLARETGAGLHVRLLTRESSALEISAFSPDEGASAARRMLEVKARHGDVLLTPDIYFRYIAEGRLFVCRPLSLLLTVDSRGRLFVPCPKWEGTKERTAGSIREASLVTLWNSPEASSIRRDAASCTPSIDCYTSCILDIALLANLSGGMLLEQALTSRSLLSYFWRRH
jgi:MoaA/NifB/PqqE/SkfB family radical SAM enzyme